MMDANAGGWGSNLCDSHWTLTVRISNFDSPTWSFSRKRHQQCSAFFSFCVLFILVVLSKGPCKKYVTPKRAIFEPPSPPCHTLSSFLSTPLPPMSLTKKWQTFYWKKYINTVFIEWYIEGKSVTCDESMKTAMIKRDTDLSNATLSANE